MDYLYENDVAQVFVFSLARKGSMRRYIVLAAGLGKPLKKYFELLKI
jgi:hypothetical protein